MTGVFTSHPASHLRTTTAFGRHGGGARHPASALRTLEINQHEADDDLASGLALLAEAGVVAHPGASAPA